MRIFLAKSRAEMRRSLDTKSENAVGDVFVFLFRVP